MVVVRDGHTGIGLPTRLLGAPVELGADPRPLNSDAADIRRQLELTVDRNSSDLR